MSDRKQNNKIDPNNLIDDPIKNPFKKHHISTLLDEAMTYASARYECPGTLPGIPCALPQVDAVLGGFQDTFLYILAGRPGAGKTALGTQIAKDCATDKLVAFLSLEQSADELALRILADVMGESLNEIKLGSFQIEQFERAREVVRELGQRELYITSDINRSYDKLSGEIERFVDYGAKLILVDYLQLVQGKETRNRNLEIAEITGNLKKLAVQHRIPILMLSQLNRKTEDNKDRRPNLSNLRDSGSIEQDADVVIFLHREEYYLQQEMPNPTDTVKYQEWEGKNG